MAEIYVHDAIFLLSYLMIAGIIIVYSKNIHKILLYIILPLFLSFIIFILSQLLYYKGILIIYPLSLLFSYYAFGFWIISVFSFLTDIILSYLLK
jgi:hypothetical protein